VKKDTLQRTCIGCGRKNAKDTFLRFIISPEHTLLLDIMQRWEGRGGYLCPQKRCFHLALKKRGISRRLRKDVVLVFDQWINDVAHHLLDFIHAQMERVKTQIVEEHDLSGVREKIEQDEVGMVFFPLTTSVPEHHTQIELFCKTRNVETFLVPLEMTEKGMSIVLKRPKSIRRLHQAIRNYLSLSSV
jgi:uncharacterized protein